MVQSAGTGIPPSVDRRMDSAAIDAKQAAIRDVDNVTTHATVAKLPAQMRALDLTDAPSGEHLLAPGKKRNTDPRIALLQTQCLKLSLSIFSRPGRHSRSLGFTSAIPGEGKSFLATLTATSLASKSHKHVTLVDCNWESATLHTLFDLPPTPGLAEWLRHECDLDQIRRPVSPYLTIISAGDGLQDSIALTDTLRTVGAHTLLTHPDEALIVDMAPVLTTSYGALLAQQLDAILLVVRSGVTWDAYIQEACHELSASAVEGVILNATRSRIPRWLQRII